MRIVFLRGAEDDLKDLRRYLIGKFGKLAWQESYEHLKLAIRNIAAFPESGTCPEELAELATQQYRQIISGQNRVIYEIRDDFIYIHIVCDCRRDMRTLLARRLVRVVK